MNVDSLRLLIHADNPIVLLETGDEPRAVALIRDTARQLSLPVIEWSVTEGLRQSVPEWTGRLIESDRPIPALQSMKASGYTAIYLFKDLGPHCKDPQVARLLRDLYFSPNSRLWTMVMLDSQPLPPEVRRLTVPFDVGCPNEEELAQVVRDTFRAAKRQSLTEIESRLTQREFEQLVRTLRGLTVDEATRIVAAAIHQDTVFDGQDLAAVLEAKRKRLETTGCLETVVADFALDDIGGLGNLKHWLDVRRGGFSAKAQAFGLDPPRGILLLGVQGCGKSLCAKVVASTWHMPLMRMDPGVLYQKYIGESESRLREALSQAQSMAPVVLWIDEIEKAFASASSVSADGGLSQRMFGTLLAWMQDHRYPIFLVATANNVSELPPELMRKGRFDEVFFVDLPRTEDREAIFGIHLRKRRREPAEFDVAALAKAAEGFSGAEIEQAIVSGMYSAFAAGQTCATEHLLWAIRATNPLSVLMRESVDELRAWAAGRCVPAD